MLLPNIRIFQDTRNLPKDYKGNWASWQDRNWRFVLQSIWLVQCCVAIFLHIFLWKPKGNKSHKNKPASNCIVLYILCWPKNHHHQAVSVSGSPAPWKILSSLWIFSYLCCWGSCSRECVTEAVFLALQNTIHKCGTDFTGRKQAQHSVLYSKVEEKAPVIQMKQTSKYTYFLCIKNSKRGCPFLLRLPR